MLFVLFVFDIYIEKNSLSDGHFTIDKCWFWVSDFGFYMVYTVVLNASYEIESYLLNDFMFSCCFHVFLNIFLCHGWTLTKGWVGVEVQISNVESTLNVAQWVWMTPLREFYIRSELNLLVLTSVLYMLLKIPCFNRLRQTGIKTQGAISKK